MTLPTNVATSTVTGLFVGMDGTPAAGTVTFLPIPMVVTDPSAGVVMLPVSVVATLDAGGAFSVELVATDDVDLNPTDWAYGVALRLTPQPYPDRFLMYAPAGSTTDLSAAMPVVDPASGVGYISGIQGPPGEGVPPGGTAGQVLAKLSGADFDTAWSAASAPGAHATTHAAGGTDPVALTGAQVSTFGTAAPGVAPASGGGTTNFLRADGTWAAPVGSGGVTDGDKGDIVVSDTGATWLFDSSVVTTVGRALLNDTTAAQQRATLGLGSVDNTADSAKPISAAQSAEFAVKADKVTTITPIAPLTGGGSLAANRTLSVDTFGTSGSGVVPASGGGTTNFLRADGTWAAPSGGGSGITDGDKGDIVVSASGATWLFDSGVVTATAKTVLDDATTADMLTTLGAQPADTDLTTIAALSPANDTVIQRKTGVWVASTPATVKTDLALTKTDVGLGNVDNTSDANKPVSTATTTALALKADKSTSISTTAPLTGGGDLSTSRTLDISDFTTSTKGAVPTPGGTSTGRFLRDDGTWAAPAAQISGIGGVFPFTYNTSTAEPPTGNQLRGNNSTFTSSTKLWIMETTTDGLDVTVGLGRIKAGFQVYIQDYTSAARYALFNVTADSVDKGAYFEITVALVSSAGTIPSGKVALQSLSSAQASNLFSTSTTAPGLAPGSNGAGSTAYLNGAGAWVVPSFQPLDTDLTTIAGLTATTGNMILSASSAWTSATPATVKTTLALNNVDNTTDANKPVSTATQTALDLKQDKSQTINAQTGTTYTLVLTDAGKIVTLSNASAITLTVPTNASVAFPVGTAIDLIQLAAGQFTVTGAGPPTISKSAATAKSRTQYSVVTIIKTATDVWVATGDLAAS